MRSTEEAEEAVEAWPYPTPDRPSHPGSQAHGALLALLHLRHMLMWGSVRPPNPPPHSPLCAAPTDAADSCLQSPGRPRASARGPGGPIFPGVPLRAAAVAARPRAPLVPHAPLRVGGAAGQSVLRHLLARRGARVRLPQPPHRAPRPPGPAHLPDQRVAPGQHSHAPRSRAWRRLGAMRAQRGHASPSLCRPLLTCPRCALLRLGSRCGRSTAPP